VDGQRLSEIINSLKSVYQSNRNEGGRAQAESAGHKQAQSDLSDLREQLRESTSLTRILTLQLESTKEELSESKSFYSAVRCENAQLKSETENLKAAQSELRQRLDTATKTDQPSSSTGSRWKPQQIDDAARLSYQTELSNVQSSHAKSLAAIQQSHTETTRYLQSLIKDAQQREAELQVEITTLKTKSSTGDSELAVLKSERERLEATLQSKEAAAAAADAKFASLLKKREEVWEARVERLLNDRERMGKVLMWTWGEKEVGERDRRTAGASRSENRQGYKYKYVSKAVA
jgi:chromosome segregation ATPase